MIERENPLAILTPGSVPQAFYDQLKELDDQIRSADVARQEWIDKQSRLLNQRLGIRRPKNFPWAGANNGSWPLTDRIIRHWKPGLIGLVTNVDPVCYFFGTNPDATKFAVPAQAYYHHRFTHIPDVYLTVSELADTIAQYGIAYTRQGWRYRTEIVCRVVRMKTFFPEGPEAAAAQFNQQLAQARQQLQAAIAAGQAPPEAAQQLPPDTTPFEIVVATLEREYGLSRQNQDEARQLQTAAERFLAGQETVKLAYRAIVYDGLDWKTISPMDVIIPPRTPNIDDADFVAILHRLKADDLRRMARDGLFKMEAALEVAEKVSSKTSPQSTETEFTGRSDLGRIDLNQRLDQLEGINPAEAHEVDTALVMEVYCKLDLDQDGLKERVVLWYHPVTMKCLAVYRYPYPFPEWPITAYHFEHRSKRPYSPRGAAELLSTFQREVNKQHNTRLDAMQIALMPMFQMRATAGELKKNIKFFPGSIIPVQAVGDFAPIQNNLAPLQFFLQEENVTKTLAEQFIGVFDPGVLAQNTSERRTAREVEAVTSQIDNVFGQDARLFQASMARTHRQLWYLLQEYDTEETYVRVTGENDLLHIRKAEISQDYDIVPSGTPANSSRLLEQTRAREALQVFMGDVSGLIDRQELYSWYFSLIDRNRAKLIVRSATQAAAVQTIMAKAEEVSGQAQPF
jgi:hypothetical protein